MLNYWQCCGWLVSLPRTQNQRITAPGGCQQDCHKGATCWTWVGGQGEGCKNIISEYWIDLALFYFSQFNHQGTITVNEEGTEAGAITNVGFMPLSTQIRFIVDRPFLFLIYEHRTSCLLFMGRVANPAKS